MLGGIGVDLCRVSRIKKALESQHFRDNVFSPAEISYCESKGARRFESYASCFAAREAFVKASGAPLGTVMLAHNFEVLRDSDGSPSIKLSGKLSKYVNHATVHVSLTHEGEYACAMVIIDNNEVISNDNKNVGF